MRTGVAGLVASQKVAKYFSDRLSNAPSLSNVFSLVKDVVHRVHGRRRSGLMLGLGELGYADQGFVGAYYPVDSNLIVVNQSVLDVIREKHPRLYNAYLFHVLLHEYVHSLGVHDEAQCRKTVAEICAQGFGKKHAVTRLAVDPSFLAPILYAEPTTAEFNMQAPVNLVKGFDEDAARYYS